METLSIIIYYSLILVKKINHTTAGNCFWEEMLIVISSYQ